MHKKFKVCQSCGKPLNNLEKIDSNSNKFCSVCYQNGRFTTDLTLTEMEKAVEKSLKNKPIPKFVKNRIVANLKNLDRWTAKESRSN